MTKLLALPLAIFFLLAHQAQGAKAFGLDQFPLGDVEISTDDIGRLLVLYVAPSGVDGVATRLGDADSGAYFSPNTEYVTDGYWMRAHAYGTVAGQINRLVGSVFGRREDYGTFFVSSDYSYLGATSMTYQLWRGNVLLDEETTTNAELKLYAEYSVPPRVNPWARLEDGRHGATIEFPYPPFYVLLPKCGGDPDCQTIMADKIVMRPNGLTNEVTYLTHTEVFGGGGLPQFRYDSLALGMFGRPHMALGASSLIASNGVLTVTDFASDEDELDNGIVTEFKWSSTGNLFLSPMDISAAASNGPARLYVSVSGTVYSYITFLGSAWIESTNGTVILSAASANPDFPPEYTCHVFSGDEKVASTTLTNGEPILVSGNPRVVAAGGQADRTNGMGGATLDFDRPATFALPSGNVVGNRVILSIAPGQVVSELNNVALSAVGIPEITIIGETAGSSIPSLSISRTGTNITLRWQDPAAAFTVLARESFDVPWEFIGDPTYVDGVATHTVDASMPSMRFFTLVSGSTND